jgi:hypothetical protein
MKTMIPALALLLTAVLAGQEIGFSERYVLAEDRRVPLQELVPGSEDYYYWNVLDLQNQGKLPEAEALLAQFGEKYPQAGRRQVLFNRQRLLAYARDSAGTRDYIKRTLNLQFDHQREVLPEEQQLPSRLPPELVTREALVQNALQDPGLNGFVMDAEEVHDVLLRLELSPDRQRELLGRVTWPDEANLPAMVVADLKRPNSGGFGSLAAHGQLLLAQLDQCAEAMPELFGNEAFVRAYMAKLLPGVLSDWENVPAEQEAYLERLWTFARRLPPAQNSVKAHVLFHRLSFDRAQGVYDKARFLEYAQLPRQMPYVSRGYLKTFEANRAQYANLGADFSAATRMPPIVTDEALVRDYLAHFLREADSVAEFAAWFEEGYLKEVFAETKLLFGIGNAETWFGMLDPARVKALQERVEVDFLPDNPRLFAVKDPVRLRVAVKNVPQVLVKTYEINTLNWYLQKQDEITEGVDLDGLAPGEERQLPYTQAPLLRHLETFEFPAMNRPGVWVVEFIGNGKSSRALVRKGRLRLGERLGAAGHVFRVYDQDNQRVSDAVMQVGAHAYTPDKNGEIVVPFSTAPGPVKTVVSQGAFAALHTFQHRSEDYVLNARFHLDPESLQPGLKARVLVRAALTVQGVAVDPGLLEQVALVVRTTDVQGVSSARPTAGLKLTDQRDYVAEFVVPPDLRSVEVSLTGKVEQVSTGKKVDLAARQVVAVNTTESAPAPGMLWLRRTADGCWIELIGRGGEPLVRTPVNVHLQPRLFNRPVAAVLATDEHGRIALGDLAEIAQVQAESPLAANPLVVPLEPWVRRSPWPPDVYLAAGESLTMPADGAVVPDSAVSVVEVTAANELSRTVAVKAEASAGLLRLTGLPAGEYVARFSPSCRRLRVHVFPGERNEQDILSRERAITAEPYRPLGIAECTLQGESLTVQLVNATPDTRVHVLANRLLFGQDPATALLLGTPAGVTEHIDPQVPARYVSGRTLGDELRYVLERRYAKIFPGAMVQRPSLLLNPWETRRTETEKQQARLGENWAEDKAEKPAVMAQKLARAGGAEAPAEAGVAGGGGPLVPCLDLLSAPALSVLNVIPDANGRVSASLPALGPRQMITVVVTNGQESVLRQVPLACPAETYRDLRLPKALDAATRFGELRTVSALPEAQEIVIENAAAARLQTYASVADVYALFESLAGNADLAEFRFILDWPDLPEEGKQEKYSRYACHELNVFLSRKDPEFFARVIKPYLANRRDKTLVDSWLLGADLSPYLDPWRWARLNAFEQVAVGKALPAQAAAVRRALTEVCDLRPRDPQAELDLFLRALQGRGQAEGFDVTVVTAGGFGGVPGPGGAVPGGDLLPGAPAPAAAPAAPPAPALAFAPAERSLAEAAPEAAAKADAKAGRAVVAARKSVAADRSRRQAVRRLYVAQDRTAEWAETSYWKLPLSAQTPERVPQNRFWADWAAHDGKGPFLSVHVAEATSSFTEMMLALAVLDLPCKAPAAEPVTEQGTLRLKTVGPTICYRKELQPQEAGATQEIFVRQEFTDPAAEPERTPYGERPRRIGEQIPAGRAVSCGVMVTNATADPRHVDVLLQIPAGAVPLCDALRLRSTPVLLQPYQQHSIQYVFYFPRPGSYVHYPATVSAEGHVLAQAEARTFTVTDKPKTDTGTWDYVSQFGTDDEVLAFLERHNLQEIQPKLQRIAFRLRDKAFFTKVLDLLRQQRRFEGVLWSYAVQHDDAAAMREYLPHTPLAESCGPWLESPILSVDVLARGVYEHKEYWPLVNARAHVLGSHRTILNPVFLAQYQAFLERLAYKGALIPEERLALCVYLALQDRTEEAQAQFDKVTPEAVAERLQYEAAQAYLQLCRGQWQDARTIARRYEKYSVKRWRERFGEILAQCDEIAGEEARVVDRENRTQVQTQLADTEPTLELTVENRRILIRHRNLTEITVSYYPMDVEMLFSRAPFVKDASAAFAVVRPSRSDRQETAAKGGELALDLPAEYANRNVVIEATGGGLQRSQTYTPHSLNLQMQENYGQLRVLHADTDKPLVKVYVKVYARYQDGRVEFYKDGYTDLRGRFDYSSLSTDDLAQVERFAVLVLSDADGALVREVPPPKR